MRCAEEMTKEGMNECGPWDENGRSSETASPRPAAVNVKKSKYHFYKKRRERQ
jgi:hypothetical protein